MKTMETRKHITKFKIDNKLEMQFQNSWNEVWIVDHLKEVKEDDFHTTFVFEDLDTSQEGWLETLESELI
jgi:hypothetical protein